MFKRNIGSIILSVVLSLVFTGVLWNLQTTNAQQQITLEQRVRNLEQDVNQLKWSNMQFQAWSVDQYAAILHSTNDYRVVFEHDTSWLKDHYQGDVSVYPYICALCRIGDYKHISLYDSSGRLIDSFDYSSLIKPGDLLVAWYTKTKLPNTNEPYSPDVLEVPALYWNQTTGLAVGFQKIDGAFR